MDNDQIARVAYFERQFLRARDFVDEQAYQIAMRRRHHIAHHRWGIVEGLAIVHEEGNLFVQAGMAIDGYGREIVFPNNQAISAKAFVEKNSSVLDVWVLYNLVETSAGENGIDVCTGTGVVAIDRRQESPQLLLEKPNPDFSNPREPESVPEGDRDFSPAHTPPDDPRNDWPVYLGRVTQLPKNTYTIETDNRPYIGLIGESILTPSGRAKIHLGVEEPDRRFAVYLDDEKNPHFEIDQSGQIEIRGDTTVHGTLTLAGGSLEFPVGQAHGGGPAPWRIYHATEGTIEQLRVEIDESPLSDNQFVIGHWSAEEEKFHSCLTVDNQCNVTVHGNLVVEKLVKEKIDETKTVIGPGEETKRFLVASSMLGLGGVPTLLQLLDPGRRAAVNIPEFELAVRSAVQATDETQLRMFLKVLLAEDSSREIIEDLSGK